MGHPAKTWMSAEPTRPRTLPRRPPATVRSELSTRNCAATSRRRAPRARRTPTSRVRSATLASMMFMIPIPPTSRLIAATAPVTTLKTRWVRSRWRRISRGTITSSGSPPVARRTRACATPAAGTTASGVATRKTISSTPSGRRSAPRSSAGSGTSTERLRSRPRMAAPRPRGDARPSRTPTTWYQSPPSRTDSPRGLPSGKSARATAAPSTATRLRSATSSVGEEAARRRARAVSPRDRPGSCRSRSRRRSGPPPPPAARRRAAAPPRARRAPRAPATRRAPRAGRRASSRRAPGGGGAGSRCRSRGRRSARASRAAPPRPPTTSPPPRPRRRRPRGWRGWSAACAASGCARRGGAGRGTREVTAAPPTRHARRGGARPARRGGRGTRCG